MKTSHKIIALKALLIASITIFSLGVAGLTYTLVSNNSHVSFSFNTGKPVFVTIIPGTSNLTAANFTVRAYNTNSIALSNLYINVTIDSHPNSTGQSFALNTVIALNQTNPQWIINGPFSLGINQAKLFNETFRYSGVFGFYDIEASVVQGI